MNTSGIIRKCEANLLCDVHRTPEKRLHQVSRLPLRHYLNFSKDGIAGVVHYDVEATELRLCRGECGHDLRLVRHVEREDQQLRGRVLLRERRQRCGLARGCDRALAAL